MSGVRLTEALVRRAADPASYARGYDYFAAGRVRRLTRDGAGVRATVDGQHPYRVRLETTLTGLDGECSCPHGQDGSLLQALCRHRAVLDRGRSRHRCRVATGRR